MHKLLQVRLQVSYSENGNSAPDGAKVDVLVGFKNKRSLPIQVNSCMKQMLTSKMVMELLNIKSETTLIKYERKGLVKVARRLGNQKRYSAEHIAKLTGN